MAAQSVGPGDRVVIRADPGLGAGLLTWAAWRLGAVAVPLGPGVWQSPDTLASLLARLAPALVVHDPTLQGRLGAPHTGTAPTDAEADAAILFTSGSTGPPKGVVLSHRALVHSAGVVAETFDLGPSTRLLSPGPIHTMSGLRTPWIATVAAGAAVVGVGAEAHHPAGAIEALSRHRATVWSTVPAALSYAASQPVRHHRALSSLATVLCTGAPLPSAQRSAFEAAFRVNVVDYYGLTETAGLCTAATGDQQGIGTARRALVHLVDPQGHSIRGPGHGELRVFSAGRFTRYLGDRQATARRLSGGWVCTGDHARRDHNGHLHLLGRTDRLLCAPSGENLHPEEVERALLGAPGVSGVAVVQVADRHGIARIWAVVEGEGQARALLDRVRERLGRRAVPDRLVFRKLPRSASGKMDLAALRASLAEAE